MTEGRFCLYCKGKLEGGAVKCHACGEWADERWRISDGGKVCIALIAGEVAVMTELWRSWIPATRDMLVEFGGAIPSFTRLVLSVWWMPSWMTMVVGTAIASFALVTRMRPRGTVLTCAMALGMVAIAVSYWGLRLPIYELAGSIKAQ